MHTKLFGVFAALAIAAAANAAYLPPEDPVRGIDYQEQYLFEVYNAIYGTSYSDSGELAAERRVGWELYTPRPAIESAVVWGVWRNSYAQQNFGYYTESGEHLLFSVDGISEGGLTDPYIGADGFLAVIDELPESFGFFDAPVLDGQPMPWGPFYSESSRNSYTAPGAVDPPYAGGSLSTWPNLYGETHLLILSTPNAYEYLIAVEDLPYGHVASHRDYNDFLAVLKLNVVPEPTSLALLAGGTGLLVLGRFRRRTRKER